MTFSWFRFECIYFKYAARLLNQLLRKTFLQFTRAMQIANDIHFIRIPRIRVPTQFSVVLQFRYYIVPLLRVRFLFQQHSDFIQIFFSYWLVEHIKKMKFVWKFNYFTAMVWCNPTVGTLDVLLVNFEISLVCFETVHILWRVIFVLSSVYNHHTWANCIYCIVDHWQFHRLGYNIPSKSLVSWFSVQLQMDALRK